MSPANLATTFLLSLLLLGGAGGAGAAEAAGVVPNYDLHPALREAVSEALLPQLGTLPPQELPPEQVFTEPAYEAYVEPAYYDEDYEDGDEGYEADLDDWLDGDGMDDWLYGDGELADPDTGNVDVVVHMLAKLPSEATVPLQSLQPSNDNTVQQPSLPVFAVFASSSRSQLVPSSNVGNGEAEQARPLELVVAAATHTPVPRSETRPELKFDSRYLGIVVSAACMGLLLGVLAVTAISWQRRGVQADNAEALLYSHIPGTPKLPGTVPARNTGGSQAGAAVTVPKKLSNIPA